VHTILKREGVGVCVCVRARVSVYVEYQKGVQNEHRVGRKRVCLCVRVYVLFVCVC